MLEEMGLEDHYWDEQAKFQPIQTVISDFEEATVWP